MKTSLVQRNPLRCSRYTYGPSIIDRSPTNSIESYLNLASKESQILRRNPREAKFEIVIHILWPFEAKELCEIRTKIFGYLRKGGLIYVANIEPTMDEFGNPNDTPHFHVLTDDTRSEKEIRELCYASCMSTRMLREKDFRIDYRELYDYNGYIDYFTKLSHPDKVNLFVRGTKIRRFIFSPGWFIDVEGNQRKKSDIWNEIIEETRARHNTKQQGIEPVMDAIPWENELPIPAIHDKMPAPPPTTYPIPGFFEDDSGDWDSNIINTEPLHFIHGQVEPVSHAEWRDWKREEQRDISEWVRNWVTEHIYNKKDDWDSTYDSWAWYSPPLPVRRVNPVPLAGQRQHVSRQTPIVAYATLTR